MKTLFLIFLILGNLTAVEAQRLNQPYLLISLTTGGDDLRGGQSVKATIHFHNRGSMDAIDLNEGEGWANNTTHTHQIEAYNFKPSDLRAITLFHDGHPTQAFQSYDNWNLDRIKVTFVSPGKQPRHTVVLNQQGGPLMRFTGSENAQNWTFDAVADPVSPDEANAGSGSSGNGNRYAASTGAEPKRVRIVRWVSPVTKDFESMPEGRHSDAQLTSWGFASKLYQYSAWRMRPNDPNAIAVYRWTMPNCAGSIMFGEHELTDAQLTSWGYKDKEFQFWAYRQPPNDGRRYVAVHRWINAHPQGDPCRDFTLTVAETELTDAQLASWGYTEKRLQFYVLP